MADRYLSFQELWELAIAHEKHCNSVYYHSCCDIWTTRNSKNSRPTHPRSVTWKQIMASLPKDCPDKKMALHAKIVEEGWRLPVLLNKPCQTQQPSYPIHRLPFHPHVPPRQVPIHSFTQDEAQAGLTIASNNLFYGTLL